MPDRRKNTYEQLEHRLDARLDKIETRLQRWFVRGMLAFAIIGVACTIAILGLGLTVRQACISQNNRHDDTIRLFRKAAGEGAVKHPELARQIQESTDTNLALIDALAPHKDCGYLGFS